MIPVYLAVNLFSLALPLLFSFHPKINFYKEWKRALFAILSVALFFILWDLLYTHIGVWGFNKMYLTKIYAANLPIEEILFFICIPYSCLFTYYCFKKFLPFNLSAETTKYITLGLIILCATLAAIFYNKAYTAATMIILCATLVYLLYKHPNWLGTFYISYSVLLIPFFITNGILTGTGLEQPIVWYNNNENMELRVLTIPIEDFFYGMLLILLNVNLFEYFNKK